MMSLRLVMEQLVSSGVISAPSAVRMGFKEGLSFRKVMRGTYRNGRAGIFRPERSVS